MTPTVPLQLPLALLLASLLSACAAQQRLAVAVRDASTQQPVPGVAVKVTTLNPQHALRASDWTRWLAGGPEKDAPSSLTDQSGQTEVAAPTDRPFLVMLILPGLEPESLHFRESGKGGSFEPTGWLDLPVRSDDEGGPLYQIRIAPAGEPRS